MCHGRVVVLDAIRCHNHVGGSHSLVPLLNCRSIQGSVLLYILSYDQVTGLHFLLDDE